MEPSGLFLKEADLMRCGATTVADHGRQPQYAWELIVSLKADLEHDLKLLGSGSRGKVHPSAVLYAPENMLIESGAEIEATAVLDARSGPIYIGKNTIVRPQAYLRGPLSIGPECRIGGEVSQTIIVGYSNKAHFGFLGRAYIGEWVNLGAGTTNSNLKNTYGTVKLAGVDTKQQFMGCLIGDFAKLGIGTLINTGTVIGFGANVLGGELTPKVIPSFTWEKEKKYRLDDFFKAAGRMMARRGVNLTAEEREKINQL